MSFLQEQETAPSAARQDCSASVSHSTLPVGFAAFHSPERFLAERVRDHDVVLHGTKHDCPCALETLTRILPALVRSGLTHVGLEIAEDQQQRIDRFMNEGAGLDEIEIFHAIDCPEYRSMLHCIREAGLTPAALDMPRSMWHTDCGRDEWMARAIGSIFDRAPRSKVLTIVGNLHALKRVDWVESQRQDTFIRGHLNNYMPHLKTYSIVMEHSHELMPNGPMALHGLKREPFVVETLGADFHLSTLKLIAVRPMKAHDAADALIAY